MNLIALTSLLGVALLLGTWVIIFQKRGKLSLALRIMVIGHIPLLLVDVLSVHTPLVTLPEITAMGLAELTAMFSITLGLSSILKGWLQDE